MLYSFDSFLDYFILITEKVLAQKTIRSQCSNASAENKGLSLLNQLLVCLHQLMAHADNLKQSANVALSVSSD